MRIESEISLKMIDFLVTISLRISDYDYSLKFQSYIPLVLQYRKKQSEFSVRVTETFKYNILKFDYGLQSESSFYLTAI